MENSETDGNTRPPDLPLEKPICRSGRPGTGHGTKDWFQIGKGVRQGCILSPLYAEYIMRNAGLEEAQAGIKIARRNINNHQSEWLRSKSLQVINAGEGVEKKEPSYTVGGNAN